MLFGCGDTPYPNYSGSPPLAVPLYLIDMGLKLPVCLRAEKEENGSA